MKHNAWHINIKLYGDFNLISYNNAHHTDDDNHKHKWVFILKTWLITFSADGM